MKKFIVAALFTYGATHAETENFDMTLSGYFDKDYCELHLGNPNPSITFDFSSLEPVTNFIPFHTFQSSSDDWSQGAYMFNDIDTGTFQSVTCSAGTYSINLLTSNQGNLSFDSYGSGDVVAKIYFDNTFWAEEPVYYLNPEPGVMLNLPNVSIDTPREVVRFEYTFDFTFPAANLTNLPTSINTQPSWFSILIDKVD